MALKLLCALSSHLSLPPLLTTDLATVSMALPLPERHGAGIARHEPCADWLLSLGNRRFGFLLPFHGSVAHFLSMPTDAPLPGWTTGFSPIHPLKDILVASKIWQL